MFAGITVQLRPTLGLDLLLPLFAAVILGGIGSVWGAVLGGLIVGLAESATEQLVGAEYRAAAAFFGHRDAEAGAGQVVVAQAQGQRKHGVSIANVATCWVLEQAAVAAVIVGARLGESEHRADNLQLFAFALDDEDRNIHDPGAAAAPARPPAQSRTAPCSRITSPGGWSALLIAKPPAAGPISADGC